MEMILLVVAATAAVLGVAIQLFGIQRVRRLIRLEEPEPYFISAASGPNFENDPVVGPLVKAEREAGSEITWQAVHLAPMRLNDGHEYLRTNRRKIVHRSKTYAHSDENVLMVKRKL